MRISILLIVLLCLNHSYAAKPSLEEIKFFEQKIRPVLAERCFTCHSESKQMSGLRLDSRDALVKGGERGEAIQPGAPEESLLIRAISYENDDLKMPPNRPLSKEEKENFYQWIKMGAIWPNESLREKAAIEEKPTFTEEDRNWWAFQDLEKPGVPKVDDKRWSTNPIDAFVIRKLKENGISPSPPADKYTLIRRVTYDLTGLPPTAEEIERFVSDDSPDAYENLINRLLESPRYGEKWAQHWLDLVRYAESDGYKADHYRPNAWRYRDYVIESFNEDKPYNQFVLEQLAGDEIAPNDKEAMVATHFLRLGIYEFNQRDARTQWKAILNELTDVTGDVFLGTGISCARCHDHKFDPILQEDYYRIQAFYTPIALRNDIPLATAKEWNEYQNQLAIWKAKAKPILDEIESIEQPHYKKGEKAILNTFPEDVKEMIAKSPSERTPFEQQLVSLAEFQGIDKGEQAVDKIGGDEEKRLKELYKKLETYSEYKPKPLPKIKTVSDISPIAPPTTIPGDKTQREIQPGFLTLLNPEPAEIQRLPSTPNSTGRRTALARWITRPDNPLTIRAIVNRIWQYHFGQGIVPTPSEFGRLGEPPSHPELLDWLAVTFVEQGWSFKQMHRLILTSQAYKQSSKRYDPPAVAMKEDPKNQWLWRMNARRLQAEEIRDTMLAVTGKLDDRAGGPSVDPSKPRRSIYTKLFRNKKEPLLDAFDIPDGIFSTAQRNTTTTPLQSLLMINGDWVYERAETLATHLMRSYSSNTEIIRQTYQSIFGRYPSPAEMMDSTVFLEQHMREIEQKYSKQEEQFITAIETYFNRNSEAKTREEVIAFLESKLGELADVKIPQLKKSTKIALAGGEGGPHPSRNQEDPHQQSTTAMNHSSDFVRVETVIDFCHILLNSNAFLYIE